MLVHEGGFRVEKDGEAFRFFGRWGDLIPAVPRARVAEGVERMDELGSVDPRANAPLWDGSPLDYGAAVWGLLDPRQLEADG